MNTQEKQNWLRNTFNDSLLEGGPGSGPQGGRHLSEIRKDIADHKQYMKSAGIKTLSFMNGGHSPQSSQANAKLFALKNELADSKKEQEAKNGVGGKVKAFLTKHDADYHNFGPQTRQAVTDKFNSEHGTKLSVDEFHHHATS